jgi:hypothetical protein
LTELNTIALKRQQWYFPYFSRRNADLFDSRTLLKDSMGTDISDSSELLLRKAGRQDSSLVSDILADASSDDPVSRWISAKPEFLSWGWPLIVPFLLTHDDETYMAGSGLGAALWVPPAANRALFCFISI